MKRWCLLFACLLSFPAFAATPAKTPDQTKPIEAVIEAFRTAIIDKDEKRFTKLFLHPNITWQNVTSDETLSEVRKKDPDAVKVSIDPAEENYPSFINSIVTSKRRLEEKFSNTRIETDGDVASVFFDYSFHSNDVQTNHGKEAWHLVRTEDGWKIVSVIWSVIADP